MVRRYIDKHISGAPESSVKLTFDHTLPKNHQTNLDVKQCILDLCTASEMIRKNYKPDKVENAIDNM